jgi:hypothetical protein
VIVETLLRLIPGGAATRNQIDIWRAQLRELQPLYPVVLPFLAWVFVRAYRGEQDRMRRARLAPVLRPELQLPENRADA